MLYKLVEKTLGPWHGRVWRCEEMTAQQAAEINSKIAVMQWEPVTEEETPNDNAASNELRPLRKRLVPRVRR